MSEKLLDIVPESSRQPYDMYDVIREIVDDGEIFDIKPKFARTIITCLARFGGRPAGIVASQPKHLGGILENDSADKAARFINLCDAFNIPLVPPGRPRVHGRLEGRARGDHSPRGEDAVRGRATVPSCDRRKAYGAGYYVMCGRAYEPEFVAWPSAEISVMGPEGAVNIIGRSAIEASDDPDATREQMLAEIKKSIDPYLAAKNDRRRHHRPGARPAPRSPEVEMAKDKRIQRRLRKHGDAGVSRFEDPVILTNSISGVVANKEQCPAIPYTPEEYAAEARRAVDEGASMIHIHARKPDGSPSYEVEDYRAITEAIRSEVNDVVINYSTGAVGVPIEKRIEYLRELRPDVAALNMGSMNYASTRAGARTSCSSSCSRTASTRSSSSSPQWSSWDPPRARVLRPRPRRVAAPLIDMGVLEARSRSTA